MTLANYLTLGRLFISPIFLMFYLKHEYLGISFNYLPYILLLLLTLLEVSDALDGYLARKMDQVTDLGKILDPMADSVARITVFLTLTDGIIQLPMILVFVFLYRDFAVTTLRSACALRGFALAARVSGKIKAIIQAIAIISITVMIIPYSKGIISLELLQSFSAIIVTIAAIYTFFSGFDYFYAHRSHIKKLLSNR